MGIYYQLPPHPQQGPVNSTLPIPHDTAVLPGVDQPPRRQVGAVLAMMAILASWPADLEPRLQTPNNQQNKTVPLTLTYGDQPPTHQTLSAQQLNYFNSTWQLDWPSQTNSRDADWNFPPAVPDALAGRTGAIYPAILQVWQDSLPEVELISTYVIAPDNPDAPPRQFPLSPTTTAIIQKAWEPAPPLPTLRQQNAAWNVPVPSIPVFPTRLANTRLVQIINTWQQTWDAQTGKKNAPLYPVVIVNYPYVRQQLVQRESWIEPFRLPGRRPPVAAILPVIIPPIPPIPIPPAPPLPPAYLPNPGFDDDCFEYTCFDTRIPADIGGSNSGVDRERVGEEWYTCDRCGLYYPRTKMLNQNGLNLCKGPTTRDCWDKKGHAANVINLDIPYEQNPEPLPFEDDDL